MWVELLLVGRLFIFMIWPHPKSNFQMRKTRGVARGFGRALSLPLLREGVAIGVIYIRRKEVRPFNDRQIKLLETFAAQAVIAIENVRLFKELQERNAELREALEHQTATAEVLGIISRSPTDVQPVLDAIVESATRVCGIDDVVLRLQQGDTMAVRAHFGPIRVRRVGRSLLMTQGIAGCASMVRSTFPIYGRKKTSLRQFLPGCGCRQRPMAHLPGRAPSFAGRTYWNAWSTPHGGAPFHANADQTFRNLR